jgi:hypothetical protein
MSDQPERTGLSTADLAAASAGDGTETDGKGQDVKGQVATDPMPNATATTNNGAGSASTQAPQAITLFASDESNDFWSRWDDIQAGFVDQPRQAVQQADALVAEVMTRLAAIFADERNSLEQQWDRGDNISTEDLRIAFQRYRSFFNRLLAV